MQPWLPPLPVNPQSPSGPEPTSQLVIVQVKQLLRITDTPRLEALLEPAHSLFGLAVGEGVGIDCASRLLLEPIVANLVGGVERRFDVALLQELELLLTMMRP